MDFFLDVLIDSFWDTLELVAFLFLTYLAMEALEHGAAGKTEKVVREAGKAGPAVGALLGALPQCGFSAMAATLYAGRVVTAGTLVAVILATSDEMLPVFLAHQEAPARMLAILLIKIVCGMVLGFAVDAVLRLLHRAGMAMHISMSCASESAANATSARRKSHLMLPYMSTITTITRTGTMAGSGTSPARRSSIPRR